MSVSGTVQSIEKKFEWNVQRLWAVKEGESKIARVAIAVLASGPALVLDLVRRALFAVNLVNGKSFSLIDKASAGIQTLSSKVKTAWENYKNPSLEVLNKRSESNLKSKVKDLVSAYIRLDRNFLGITRNAFGSNQEKNVNQIMSKLLNAVEEHIQLNKDLISDSKTFEDVKRHALELVHNFIEEASKDETYFGVKTDRSSKRPLDFQIKCELQKFLENKQKNISIPEKKSNSFVSDLINRLFQNKIETPLALNALKRYISDFYNQALTVVGYGKAKEIKASILAQASEKGLISPEVKKEIEKSVAEKVKVETLAKGAAIDLMSEQALSDRKSEEIAIVEKSIALVKGEPVNENVLGSNNSLKGEPELDSKKTNLFCRTVTEELAKKKARAAAFAELNREIKSRVSAKNDAVELQSQLEFEKNLEEAILKSLEQIEQEKRTEELVKLSEIDAAKDYIANTLKNLLLVAYKLAQKRNELLRKYNAFCEEVSPREKEILQNIKDKEEEIESLEAVQKKTREIYTIPSYMERSDKLNVLKRDDERIIDLKYEIKELQEEFENITKQGNKQARKLDSINGDLVYVLKVYEDFKEPHIAKIKEQQLNYLKDLHKIISEDIEALKPINLVFSAVHLSKEEKKFVEEIRNNILKDEGFFNKVPTNPKDFNPSVEELGETPNLPSEETPKPSFWAELSSIFNALKKMDSISRIK
jgi:hypothetical protein